MKKPLVITGAVALLIGATALAAPLFSPAPVAAQSFEADSPFPANPESGLGVFAFDLVIRMDMASDRASGPITLFVNSRDGSMALENPHTTLWALGMPDMPDVAIHHVIFRHGEIMACGVHPFVGEACMQLGQAMGPGLALMTNTAMAEDFYESVRWTDQDGAPDDLAGTRGPDRTRRWPGFRPPSPPGSRSSARAWASPRITTPGSTARCAAPSSTSIWPTQTPSAGCPCIFGTCRQGAIAWTSAAIA